MALTMTRTRTQTTLTKLAELVANVHGELAFVDGLLAPDCPAVAGSSRALDLELRGVLVARRRTLLANRDALYATVRQFDPEIDPGRIGASDGWRLRFGRRNLGTPAVAMRYLKTLNPG
jgi:hypothetical protein